MKAIASLKACQKKEELDKKTLFQVKTSIRAGRAWGDQSKMTWVNQSDPLVCRNYSTDIA